MNKRFPWFETLLIVVFMSANVYAAFSDAYNLPNRWFIRDDAYYYFKVAQNISEGHGSTFDGIHSTNGYHPLWMLVCIPIFALARFDLILPLRVLVIVTGVFQIATAILLYRLVRLAISPIAGMLAGIYWAFDSYFLVFLYKTGVESGIAVFFIVLLLYLLCRDAKIWREEKIQLVRVGWLAVIATLMTFGRLDLIFFALFIGIWIIFRHFPLRYLLPLDVLATFTSMIVVFLIRMGISSYYDVASLALIMAVVGTIVKIPAFYVFGLYRSPSEWKPFTLVKNLGISVIVSSLILYIILLVAASLHLVSAVSRAILLMDAALTFGFVFLIRFAVYVFRSNIPAAEAMSPLKQLKAHWKDWTKEGSTYYGILGGCLSIYMLWNKLAFGTFSPVSGDVKHWWGSFAVNVYGGAAKSMLSFLALNPYGDFNAWQPFSTMLSDWTNGVLYNEGTGFGNPKWQQNFMMIVAGAFIAGCLILLIRRTRTRRAVIQAGLIPLFVGSWFQIFAYNVTGYASLKEWYWLTEPILLILGLALLISVAYDVLLKRWLATRMLMWVIIALFGLRLSLSYLQDTYALNPYGQNPANAAYADVVPFLEKSTPPGAVIGMTGGGNVGYFIHDRTVVNMDGLINSSQYFEALRNAKGGDYLYNSGMRYVFANPSLLSALPYRGQYVDRLEPLYSWGGKDLMRLLPTPAQ